MKYFHSLHVRAKSTKRTHNFFLEIAHLTAHGQKIKWPNVKAMLITVAYPTMQTTASHSPPRFSKNLVHVFAFESSHVWIFVLYFVLVNVLTYFWSTISGIRGKLSLKWEIRCSFSMRLLCIYFPIQLFFPFTYIMTRWRRLWQQSGETVVLWPTLAHRRRGWEDAAWHSRLKRQPLTTAFLLFSTESLTSPDRAAGDLCQAQLDAGRSPAGSVLHGTKHLYVYTKPKKQNKN